MGISSTSTVATEHRSKAKQTIDLQGHRGCRGIFPENTIGGFIKALEIGVTTLEMDVVISKDNQVVVSHEPYFSHEFCTSPTGEIITEENEKEHNIYELTYDQIKEYDVGLRPHFRFTSQQKVKAAKPLLRDLFIEAEKYVDMLGLKKPFYNIEFKREPEQDLLFHPSVEEFAKLVIQTINSSGVAERVCIQAFDHASLQIVKRIAPKLTTSLIVENDKPARQNIEELGFLPDIYSPSFELVTQSEIDFCREKNLKVIPWTVNARRDMLRMIQFKVDGIITDYPGQLKKMLQNMEVKIK